MNETVLVVDDEERIGSALRGILSDGESSGWLILRVALGVMDLIARETPAIVLLDVWMPDVDGIELLRRIKPEQPLCPGDDLFRRREYPERGRGDQLGAADFIQKPFSVSGLLASIARALEGDSAGPDLSNPRGLSAEARAAGRKATPADWQRNRRAINRDGRAG